MDHELKVIPVKQDPDKPVYRETHENILSPPFRMAFVGASKSGKSNLLMNYVARCCYYGGDKKRKIKPCFNKIVVFSPNLGLDSTTRHLRELSGEDNIFTTYSDGYIANLIEGQKQQDGKSRDKVLIIADDLLAMNVRPEALIFSSSSYLRHLDCSILYLTQTYQSKGSLPPVVRNNIDGLIMFKCPSYKQINNLCEDLQGTFGSKKNVNNLLTYATSQPYNFCFFDYRDLRVFHNHERMLWQKYDDNGNFNSEFKMPTDDDYYESDEN